LKIIVNKNNFLEILQKVQRAVSSKNAVLALAGILLETTEEGKLKLSATDLEIGMEAMTPAQILEQGKIVLPAKYLVEIVRKLGEDPIQIIVDKQNNTANIHSGSFNLNIHGYSPDDFPAIPWIQQGFCCSLQQPFLKEMLRQTSFAVSHDETRPFLTGVLISLEEKLRLVATDGHRMALREADFSFPEEEVTRKVIVPAKTINELSRVLGDEENSLVEMVIGENQASFQLENLRLITRLIEGQFPNYRQIIPQNYKTRVRVQREDLADALERASLIVKGESNIVKIILQKEKMIITSNTPEIGRSQEEIACFLEGEELQIAFNFKYFLDVLKILDSEEVTIDFTGSLSPSIIRAVEMNNYTYIIMPVRSH